MSTEARVEMRYVNSLLYLPQILTCAGHLMKVSRIMAMRSVSHDTFETLCEFVKLLLDNGVRLDDRTVNDDPLLWYAIMLVKS